MVDPDILRQKTSRVLHHLDRLRAKHLQIDEIQRDEDLRNIILMDLQQAIQGCIDLAAHWCVDEQLGSPSDAAGSFAILADTGRITAALARKLAGATGLRNLIVHQYGDLDVRIILDVIQKDLDDLEEFLRYARPG